MDVLTFWSPSPCPPVCAPWPGLRKRLAVHRHDPAGADVFVIELGSGTMSRLTNDPGGMQDNSSPIWSPDGSRIVFGSFRNNKWGLYLKRSDGDGKEELLDEAPAKRTPMNGGRHSSRGDVH